MCNIKIDDELEEVLTKCANRLRLKLGKTKQMLFRRSNIHLDILPVRRLTVESNM